ncbi:hypothetical protein PSQ19_06210 [Devosia algicola]|uniref:Uncharacterized protein n=1 Tax=Devosia algicola TaxID=3026418 RepID=A0ABY7YQY0_9HYPH|nr:hypothetical protein [Devosia algicola]WDR03661.1 hypothetical protein PSQ19_06210 [Devosia algicola]
MATPDPDYKITTYRSENAPTGKEWCARVQHPRTQLHVFFEAPSEAEVISLATEFWERQRKEREAAWARIDEARAKRAAAIAEKKAKVVA